jgi:hypothetical protein
MEIYKICSLDESDDNYVVPIALEFSEEHNITEDYDKWANQKPENVLDGGMTPEAAKKQAELKSTTEWKETTGKESIRKYKETIGKEKIQKISETRSSKEWKETIGKESRRKISEARLNREFKYNVYRGESLMYTNVYLSFINNISQALKNNLRKYH